MKRLLVVGGGVAGLIGALEARRLGLQVVLVERAKSLGGRARTRISDGYALNQGAHALYRAGAFKGALDRFGVPVTGRTPNLARARALWTSGTGPLPVTLAGVLSLAPLTLRERLAVMGFMTRLSRGGFEGASGAFADVIGRRPRRVRAVLESLARLSTYANAPEVAHAGSVAAQMRLALRGVVYVDGGWASLIAGLEAKAIAAGVVIKTGWPAAGLERRDGVWRLYDDASNAETGAAALLAVPPAEASRLVGPGSGLLAAAARRTTPIRATTLDLGLARRSGTGPSFLLGMDRPVYGSIHSQAARLAPEGGVLLHLARYHSPADADGSSFQVELEALAAAFDPDWRDGLVVRQRLIDMPVAFDLPMATDGGRRQGVRLADAPGLYLAGDWVGERGMLSDASAASALEALRAAGEDLPAATT